MVENDCAKILLDFQIQTDKQVMANQLDILLVDKEENRAAVINVAVQNACNIKDEDTSDPNVYWSTCYCQSKAERVATPYI